VAAYGEKWDFIPILWPILSLYRILLLMNFINEGAVQKLRLIDIPNKINRWQRDSRRLFACFCEGGG
jgi:hypothetical protein